MSIYHPAPTDDKSPDPETCPNGCDLAMFKTHQGPPDCDRQPRDPEWYDPAAGRPAEIVTSTARRLAWFTDDELRAELDRRAQDDA